MLSDDSTIQQMGHGCAIQTCRKISFCFTNAALDILVSLQGAGPPSPPSLFHLPLYPLLWPHQTTCIAVLGQASPGHPASRAAPLTFCLQHLPPFFPACLLSPIDPQDLAQGSHPPRGCVWDQLRPALSSVARPCLGPYISLSTHWPHSYHPSPCRTETEAVSVQCFIPVPNTAVGPGRWLFSVTWINEWMNKWRNEKKVWNGSRNGRIWGGLTTSVVGTVLHSRTLHKHSDTIQPASVGGVSWSRGRRGERSPLSIRQGWDLPQLGLIHQVQPKARNSKKISKSPVHGPSPKQQDCCV